MNNTGSTEAGLKQLFQVAGCAALAAMCANIADVMLGMGETEVFTFGTKSATDWFAIFQASWFKGLYTLGIFNIVYMTCMVPVYIALYHAHRRVNGLFVGLAMAIYFIGTGVYLANNAAIPMLTLSSRYAAATTDAQRLLIAAAGEAVLARGEDFTPGSFIGLFLQGAAAIGVSLAMLRGRIFGTAIALIGLIGFTFLTLFTISATYVPALYEISFYLFGMIGGMFALAWFFLVARSFFKLSGQTIS